MCVLLLLLLLLLLLFPVDTSELIRVGSNIKHGGASGAFDSEFREMEMKLDEVRRILGGNTDVPTDGIDSLQKQLAEIRYLLQILSILL